MISYTYNIGIYIYSGVYGSVGHPQSSNTEVPGSTPGSSGFSLVSINNLKTLYQNTRKK